MRRRARIDSNHNDIVEALRKFGASVQSLATIGSGCPDLLVGYCGHNFVFEVKDGTKKPSARRLTEDEKAWGILWRGVVHVVTSAEHAIEIIKICTY